MNNVLTGQPLTADELRDVSRLAERFVALEKAVEEAEKLLEGAKANLHDMAFNQLPDAMKAIGLESFTLSSGESVSLEPVINAKLPDAKESWDQRKKAFKWLRDNNHDGIIKSFLSFRFDRGSDSEKKWLMDTLKAANFKVKPEEKDDVHWQTLRAFVKEQLAAGTNVPRDLFGIFIGTRAKVEGKQ